MCVYSSESPKNLCSSKWLIVIKVLLLDTHYHHPKYLSSVSMDNQPYYTPSGVTTYEGQCVVF